MFAKKTVLSVLFVCAIFLVVGIGSQATGTAFALTQARGANASGVTVPYTGRLTNEVGEPAVDGAYDFIFTLYDSETAGAPLWRETQLGVQVTAGDFVTALGNGNPILPAALEGGQRWLAVSVREPGAREFAALAPRQLVSSGSSSSPSPALAGAACPHDHTGESWTTSSGTGLLVDATSSTGIGIVGRGNNGTGAVGVRGSSASGYGLFGASTTGYAVYGVTTGTGKAAVYGTGPGIGVHGEGTGTSAGVYGHSANGRGVSGVSDNNTAVIGMSFTSGKYGGEFVNTGGTGLHGQSWGNSPTNVSGVFGENFLSTGGNTYGGPNGVYGMGGYNGVKGESPVTNGNGVVGIANSGTSAYGISHKLGRNSCHKHGEEARIATLLCQNAWF
jgi:hypothetical protein